MTKQLLAEFDRLHRINIGVPAFIRTGKDAALVARLAKSQGEAMTRALMADYFTSTDPFIRAHGYGVGVFISVAPKLIARHQRAMRRDWRVECATLHDGRCPNVHFHQAMKGNGRDE